MSTTTYHAKQKNKKVPKLENKAVIYLLISMWNIFGVVQLLIDDQLSLFLKICNLFLHILTLKSIKCKTCALFFCFEKVCACVIC